MKKEDTVNGGAWGTKFKAVLDTDVCDRYNNAEITVVSKLYLKKGDPTGGANSGMQNDSNGNAQPIRKWSDTAWDRWKKSFVRVCTNYSGKFWLINNSKWGEYEDKGVKYYPNIWCRHAIELVNSTASAHHTITIYRVKVAGRDFRSNFSLMDSHDIQLQNKKKDSRNRWIKQRPAVHEYFHTLGVRHIDHGEVNCPIADSGNASTCYGDTDADRRTLMGSGMKVHTKFADPWRRAAIKLTGKGTIASATAWLPVLKRHYPRTLAEVDAGRKIKRKPRRG